VRHGFIAEKYAVLIDAFYSGATHRHIATEVKFEDGRRGSMEADLKIIDVKPSAVARKAA
jgi:long-chain acyl-CoA synthetase